MIVFNSFQSVWKAIYFFQMQYILLDLQNQNLCKMMFKTLFVVLIAAPLCQAGVIDANTFDDAIQSFDLPAARFQLQKQGIESVSAQSVATSISSGHSLSTSNSKAIAQGSNRSDKLFSAHNANSEAKSLAQEGSVSKSNSFAKSNNKQNIQFSVVPNVDQLIAQSFGNLGNFNLKGNYEEALGAAKP